MSTTVQSVPSPEGTSVFRNARLTLILLAVLFAVLFYCFANSLSALLAYWSDPRYSFGFVVPVFAVILMWMRWDPKVLQPFGSIPAVEIWCGLGLLAVGLGARLYAGHYGYEVPDMLAFLPSLAGICLLCGGWRLLLWTAPIIVFLGFMFPLPWRIDHSLLVPLQKWATSGSEYLFQMLGYPTYRNGNEIELGAGVAKLKVVDACSGLRMLTVFMALCAAVALVIQRPWWERLLIFASALPIAIVVNILRITATGLASYYGAGEMAYKIFHDGAGLVMMPLALLILYLEVLILGKMFVEEEAGALERISPVGVSSGRRAPRQSPSAVPLISEKPKKSTRRRKHHSSSTRSKSGRQRVNG